MELGRLRLREGTPPPDDATAAFDKALALRHGDAALTLSIAHLFRDFARPGEGADGAADYLARFLRMRPKDVGAWLELARLNVQQGRWDQAADAYAGALKAQPDGAPPVNVCMDLAAMVPPDKIDLVFAKVAERRPEDANLWLGRGDVLASRNQWAEAMDAYNAAVKRKPDDPRPWRQRAAARLQRKQWDEAADDFAAAFERAPKDDPAKSLASQPASADPLFQVEEVFTKVTERRPKDPWPWVLRARFHAGQGRPDQAEADYGKAVEVRPDEPAVWFEQGMFLLSRPNKADKAPAAVLKALELLPDAPPYPPEHRRIYDALAGAPPALFNAVSGVRPKDPWLLALRARRQPTLAEAEADLAKAVDLRPEEATFRYDRAAVYGRWGKWDKAAADYAAARKLRELDDAYVWSELLAAQAAAGDRDGCRASGKRMFELYGETEDPVAAQRTALGCLLPPDPPADPHACLRLAEKAFASDLDSPWNAFTLALAQHRTGRHEDAAALVTKYLEGHRVGVSGDCIVMHWLVLGLAQHGLGRDDEARKWIDQAARRLDEIYPPGNGRLPSRPVEPWHIFAMCQVLRAEAEADLKEPAPKPEK
jgi:tetratricopeptide (TPR) repeat protein